MAMFSTIAMAATGVASLGVSAIQASKGAKQAKSANKAIQDYKRQVLNNPYKDMQVSTMGADLQREENARNLSTSVDALQSSGLTGLSMIPMLSAQTNIMNQKIGADLDSQFKEIEKLIAGGEDNVQQMYEQRERDDLAGLGAMAQAGEQNKYSGYQNVISSAGTIVNSIEMIGEGKGKGNGNDQDEGDQGEQGT